MRKFHEKNSSVTNRTTWWLMTVQPHCMFQLAYTLDQMKKKLCSPKKLTRCVEIFTSQKLNNNEFYRFGNATFPLRDSPNSEPDATSEIRSFGGKSKWF
ncbi:hypothetical protein GCK72_023456 [Caenorhabditis remanei]|uniref:Uncharacterized protein n=1 Tax=Caenorhabditis remanei TaxID=31234 RepID=A0A6A5FWI3_CAERE|nr:hypothetical protein GCK72_023456 [Caenorhabditis remanei]KAF1746998.1 hypothetical protein GCK72_023456 [Caenorhabditis remanei]